MVARATTGYIATDRGYTVVVLSNVSRSGAQALANYARMLIARGLAPPSQ
jgi:hypothetical protein